MNTNGGLGGTLHVCDDTPVCMCVSPDSQGRFLSKRCSNLSTCVLGKLSQELHKLQTFPQTDVGAGTPGKKRSLLEGNQFTSYEETFNAI